MIGVLDYGVGNVRAFANIYEMINIPYKFVTKIDDFDEVDRIILPGVGAFDYAMSCLNLSGLKEELDRLVLEECMPVLGVCVGFQMMAKSSEEGNAEGLGWIDAAVRKIPRNTLDGSSQLPLPQMGWNTISSNYDDLILKGIEKNSRFYFLHSYYVDCKNRHDVVADVIYGSKITSIIKCNNIYGIQQHPEKSHDSGVQFLKNFASI